MLITINIIKDKLNEYLTNSISLSELVDWAENAMMEDEFASEDNNTIRDIVSRLGLADTRYFGLSWDDCVSYVNRLGFKVKLELEYA